MIVRDKDRMERVARSCPGGLELEVCWLSRPKQGETENGDIVVVRAETDATLLGVVDVLGHGPMAAKVAQAAADFLRQVPLAVGALGAMTGLHAALNGTRGAAALLCAQRGSELEVCGVGNVEFRCDGMQLPMALIPGILGSRALRPPRSFKGALAGRCRVAVHSDGISGRFSLSEYRRLSTSAACASLFEHARNLLDDASLLVADLSLT